MQLDLANLTSLGDFDIELDDAFNVRPLCCFRISRAHGMDHAAILGCGKEVASVDRVLRRRLLWFRCDDRLRWWMGSTRRQHQEWR